MVGNGKGSWQMRGVQLGAALGARVTTMPSDDDWRWADIVVLVKRAGAAFAALAHRFDVPIVWDAVDFWRQPAENGVSPDQAVALARGAMDSIKPALVIGATQAMADAIGGVYLPHHSWAGLVPTPPRETVKVVGYQGGVVYLGRWKAVLEQECARRDWTFVINPTDLSAVDILVAFRDGMWDGWICEEWKSGVKVVNAVAAGRPIITQSTAAMREIGAAGTTVSGPELWSVGLDHWSDYGHRVEAYERAQSLAPAYQIEQIAAQYRLVLESVQVAA